MERNKSNIRSFEDLKVWQLAREIRNLTFKIVITFPDSEKYRLTDQILRCSRSIGDNLAEGYGRYHYQENIQYCRQARGSAYELINHLITASDCEYISESTLGKLKEKIINCIRMINGFIRFLKKKKTDGKVNEESEVYYTNKKKDS